MSEKQEKVWVVSKRRFGTEIRTPIKVFDDRQDARNYVRRWNMATRKYAYHIAGVRKG